MIWRFGQQITSSEVLFTRCWRCFQERLSADGVRSAELKNMQTDISYHQPYPPSEAVKPSTPCIHHVPRFTYRFTARRDERLENTGKKKKQLIIWRNGVTAMDWKPERESGRLERRCVGWWINMERGNTSSADSWWKTARNVLKLNWHAQRTAQLVLRFIQTPSLNLPWFTPWLSASSFHLSFLFCPLYCHIKKN